MCQQFRESIESVRIYVIHYPLMRALRCVAQLVPQLSHYCCEMDGSRAVKSYAAPHMLLANYIACCTPLNAIGYLYGCRRSMQTGLERLRRPRSKYGQQLGVLAEASDLEMGRSTPPLARSVWFLAAGGVFDVRRTYWCSTSCGRSTLQGFGL